ncbi:hypothetical protein O3P69_004578 [Scylla paramamosain]|uniref:Uncharacterized protein n=1 Tax=Scylla paramamosain TaxID=85552 RepID=A0AAW0UCL6_SCYPA
MGVAIQVAGDGRDQSSVDLPINLILPAAPPTPPIHPPPTPFHPPPRSAQVYHMHRTSNIPRSQQHLPPSLFSHLPLLISGRCSVYLRVTTFYEIGFLFQRPQ